jgi:hypothetical protein
VSLPVTCKYNVSDTADFEKANEIYFRLGIIYKQQKKFSSSLDVSPDCNWYGILLIRQCFRYILENPPRPLTSWDIWFQLGHVYEQDGKVSATNNGKLVMLIFPVRGSSGRLQPGSRTSARPRQSVAATRMVALPAWSCFC